MKSIFEKFLVKQGLKYRSIRTWTQDICEFDLYIQFVNSNWDSIIENDFEIYSEILEINNVSKQGIKRRISHIRRFIEFVDNKKINK